MPGFNTVPGTSGGGGGQPNMTFVGSVNMSTYNRSWAQGGAAGNYMISSTDQLFGFVYFVGSGVVTGGSMNRLIPVDHAFTSINIVGTQGDLVSLYKAKIKATTEYTNALPTFPYSTTATPTIATLTSGTSYSLPANSLPFINVVMVGGGGGGGRHGGGGGGGGNVFNLLGWPTTPTISYSVGSGTAYQSGSIGGSTTLGYIYALGGGFGADHGAGGGVGGNGGGGGGHSGAGPGGLGVKQDSTNGFVTFSPTTVNYGGNPGASAGLNTHGGAGGGAGGAGSGRQGGPGFASTITGSTVHFGSGGGGGYHSSSPGFFGGTGWTQSGYGAGGHGGNADGGGAPDTTEGRGTAGGNGVIVIKSFIA